MKKSEDEVIDANAKLLVRGDESTVVCEQHGVKKRWGDLCPVVQIAILAGLDIEGDHCIMERQ